MPYCVKCGTLNGKKATFCENCGVALSQHSAADTETTSNGWKWLPLASLVIGISGLFLSAIISAIAAILGGFSIWQSGNARSQKWQLVGALGLALGSVGIVYHLIQLVLVLK